VRTERALVLVALALGAGYLLWRLNEARGGPVTYVSPFTPSYLPGEPSPAGSEGTGNTNPLSGIIEAIGRAFKLPGNASSVTARAAAPGTPVNPIGPPDTVTLTAQPERSPFLPEEGYVSNLGDPNFNAWDYLASTPPDLAWGMTGGGDA